MASGRDLGLALSATTPTGRHCWPTNCGARHAERIDLVAIVTPNHVHFPVARAFAEAGVHVVCDKPLVHTSEQARELGAVVARSGVVFGVTYNYTGYPMVREARELVRRSAIGEVRKVIVEYNQGWLATRLEEAPAEAGRLAHRPGTQWHCGRDRRHRFACREPGGHGHRAGTGKPVR